MTEKKEAVFVICEYNPFHFGHMHQLTELKKSHETVICIMSGDFVQRGEAAVYAKKARAEAAVACGADAVFELVFPFSCMAAHDFAAAGVYLAAALGCRRLAFGAEDSGEKLLAAADVVCDRKAIAELMKEKRKLSYPKAVSLLLEERLGSGGAELVSKPNNILGAEYISAARRLGADMDFEVVRRDMTLESSSVIRSRGDVLPYIPEKAAGVLSPCPRRDMKRLDGALMAATLRLSADSDVYGLDSGEVMRLAGAAMKSLSADETVEKAVSATMTRAKARRGMLAALLGITRGDAAEKPLYTNLLALGENGAAYISRHRKELALPIATKLSHVKKAGAAVLCQYERGVVAGKLASLSEPPAGTQSGTSNFTKQDGI